jgi:lantibiotic transport system permease protein
MNLLISFRTEVFKIRRTAAFYFTLIGAAVVPVIMLLNVLMDGFEDIKADHLNKIFNFTSTMNGLVIFPMFVILVCTLLPQIEYRNNTWKQVLTTPQSKLQLFIAKFLNIHLLIVLFLVANFLFMLLTIVAAHFIVPSVNLLSKPLDGSVVFTNIVNSYATALAICSIQFWLGLRFKNFLVPIGIGLAAWLTGTLMVVEFKSSFADYFPYSFHIFSVIPPFKERLDQVVVTSSIYASLFLVLGFLDFRRRKMVG